MTRIWVGFLQGLNVGKRRVKMADLRAAFADMGFADAKTLLASGNVIFSASEAAGLAERIALGLEERLGFAVPTILRTGEELLALVASDPFSAYAQSEAIKRYVYLFAEPIESRLTLPIAIAGDFELFAAAGHDLFAVGYKTPSGRFGPGLDRFHFPQNTINTSRNWQTLLRLAETLTQKASS